jgi:hypothetical protein
MRDEKVTNDCKSCKGFGIIYLPEFAEDAGGQKRWLFRKVKCAACYVQMELGL